MSVSGSSTSSNPKTPTFPKATYQGNCHCGNVVFTMKLSPPFPEYKVNQCNCSICTKNGYLLVYPLRHDVEWISGFDKMKGYKMGAKVHTHRFCPECSSSVMIDFDPEVTKKFGKGGVVAMNVRLLRDYDPNHGTVNGVKLSNQKTYFDGFHKLDPPYQAP